MCNKYFQVGHFPRLHDRLRWTSSSRVKKTSRQKLVDNVLHSVVCAHVFRCSSTTTASSKIGGGYLVLLLQGKNCSFFVNATILVNSPRYVHEHNIRQNKPKQNFRRAHQIITEHSSNKIHNRWTEKKMKTQCYRYTPIFFPAFVMPSNRSLLVFIPNLIGWQVKPYQWLVETNPKPKPK